MSKSKWTINGELEEYFIFQIYRRIVLSNIMCLQCVVITQNSVTLQLLLHWEDSILLFSRIRDEKKLLYRVIDIDKYVNEFYSNCFSFPGEY